ncbi:MAG: hypothetical protein ACIARR_00210 [Phycisphaerales bacterium JB059]
MSDTNPTNEHAPQPTGEPAFQVPDDAFAPPRTATGAGTGLPFEFPSGQGAIEEVFLTPRVIDQSAFTRYSETLKQLIREASGSGETLQSNARSAHALVEESNAAGMHLRTKIEAGAKLVKMFDERIARSEQLLADATKRADEIRELDQNIDARVVERLESLEERIGNVFDAFESKANQTEQRLVTAEQTALRHAQKLEELTTQLESRIGEIEGRATEIIARAERASAEADERAQTLTAGLETRAAELARTGEPVERLCRRTLSALGLDPDGHGEGDEQAVNALLESSGKAREEATLAMQRLTEIKGQADEARQLLGNSIIEAAERIDSLSQQATQARTQASEGIEMVRSVRPEIEQTVRDSKAQLDALRSEQGTIERSLSETGRLAKETAAGLEQQKQELEALLDASVQRLGSRVEEAGAWLGGLITRAAQTGQALERLAQSVKLPSEPTPEPEAKPAEQGEAPNPPTPTIPSAPSWAPSSDGSSSSTPSAWSRP